MWPTMSSPQLGSSQPAGISPDEAQQVRKVCRALRVGNMIFALEATVMLKHAATLGMFAIAGLTFAVGSSAPTTLVGFAMLGVAMSCEVAAWHRVVRARHGDTGAGRN